MDKGSWTLDVSSAFPLTVDGKQVAPEELQKWAGSSFNIVAGENVLSFKNQGDSVELTINGAVTEVLSGNVHLDMNPMACCIGEACIMWPAKPAGFEMPKVETKSSKWSFDDIQLAGPGPFEVDGKQVSTDDLIALAGTSFELWAGENNLAFKDLGEGSVSITLNGEVTEVFDHPLHLNINPMAVCIGEACVMWPSTKLQKPKKFTEEDFLQSIREKLGDDYTKFIEILSKKIEPIKPVATVVAAHDGDHGHGSVPQLKTKEAWEKAIRTTKPIVVDCSAVWCAPCKEIAPKYEEFAKQYADKIDFYAADIQVNTYVASAYKVASLPCFLFIKDGKEVTRQVGKDAEELEAKIKAFASSSITADAPVLKEERPTHYDYIVIGGGSGGMASAKEAAKLGAKVAVFDYVKPSTQNTTWGLGGTCVNVGCVPKKLMHYAALCGEQLHDARTFGWSVGPAKHDWKQLVDNVQAHVKKLNFFYEKGLASANKKTLRPAKPGDEAEEVEISKGSVIYYNALATFSGPQEVSWKDDFGGEGKITGDHVLIAVGGRPTVPKGQGIREYAITSDDLFSLTTPPGKTLCVGAGYISLECGGFLSNLGYDTTIAVRSVPLRVGPFDRQCVDKVVSLMELQGTRFLYKVEVKSIVKQSSGRLLVTFENVTTKEETSEEFDTVLYATGRHADTSQLGLEAAGVKTTEWGSIDATEKDETNVSNVYAIGDVVTGRPELTPVAIQAGELLARRLFAGASEIMDYVNIPTAVFTPFEYGLVGLSEEDAIKKFGAENVNVYLSSFQSLELGAAHRVTHPRDAESGDFPTNAISKLICNKLDNDRVVGFHYVGPNAGEVTQGFALGLRLGATKKDFTDLVGIHPTDAESFCSLSITKKSGEEYESAGGCGGGKCG
eukprot:TRINITY_DN2945_c0_g1_i1.p1 TRINITY_DN2945_c0_g1~~TRINITY_DN2945_c0_g1_i1.p1  ORF type:complete len:985 (-),score=260.09 TRINITY_DN2945_c0_g1_i1:40-2730(-)